jgi:hypothetical protein
LKAENTKINKTEDKDLSKENNLNNYEKNEKGINEVKLKLNNLKEDLDILNENIQEKEKIKIKGKY